jgi:hypothetical protein
MGSDLLGSRAFSGSLIDSVLLLFGAVVIFEDWSWACSFLSIFSWFLALRSEELEREYDFLLEWY